MSKRKIDQITALDNSKITMKMRIGYNLVE